VITDFRRQGLGYVLSVPEIGSELAVDRLTRTRGELHGELRVASALTTTRSRSGILHQARFNLSGATSRTSLSKTLAWRANSGDSIDWYELLEELCSQVLNAERAGEADVEMVGTLPLPVHESYRLDPILPEGQVTILYGDGGVGKSTLAAAIGVSVETGISVIEGWAPRRANVLYLDWEAGKASLNRRVRGVAVGANLPSPASLRYMDCRRRGAVYGFAENIAAIVDAQKIGLVIVDSIGMAAGTGAEAGDANETAIRLFSAFGYFGTTVLAIDHVSKAEAEVTDRPSRPYGSVYKSLLARATFELRQSGNVRVLYNTKANDHERLGPVALEVAHDEDGSIAYTRLDAIPERVTPSDLRTRLREALDDGLHLTTSQLAGRVGATEHTVRTVLNRYKDDFNRLASGRWEALPEPRNAAQQ
jgi:hypothetical protein